jgi:hypothetical protein
MPQIAFNSQSSNSCPQHGHVPQNNISTSYNTSAMQPCNPISSPDQRTSDFQHPIPQTATLWAMAPPTDWKQQLVHTRYSNPTWKMQTALTQIVFLGPLSLEELESFYLHYMSTFVSIWGCEFPSLLRCLQLWSRLPPQWFPYLMDDVSKDTNPKSFPIF